LDRDWVLRHALLAPLRSLPAGRKDKCMQRSNTKQCGMQRQHHESLRLPDMQRRKSHHRWAQAFLTVTASIIATNLAATLLRPKA
jgi:hypothetical protein